MSEPPAKRRRIHECASSSMESNSILETTIQDVNVTDTTFEAIYTPLEDNFIRLLRILPAEEAEEISCQLLQVSLHDQPTYTALSYAWGSGVADCTIGLNGHHFQIGKNLWRFLRCARRAKIESFGWLWIDALCINQRNNTERTQQVTIMGQIFKRAEQVVAWLGPSYGESELAMKQICKPAEYWRRNRNLFKIWTTPKGQAIRGICVRPYWSRLWIFQELALARRIQVMCGDKIIIWAPLKEFLLEVYDRAPPFHIASGFEYQAVRNSSAIALVKELSTETSQANLMSLMHATQNLRCSENLDRVYALLSVANGGTQNISPDYRTTIPELLNQVLRNQHKIQPPESVDQIATQCRQLAKYLGGSDDLMFHWDTKAWSPSLQDNEIQAYRMGVPGHPVTLWWAVNWGHTAVLDLLFDHGILPTMDAMIDRAIKAGHAAVVKLLLRTGKVEKFCESKLKGCEDFPVERYAYMYLMLITPEHNQGAVTEVLLQEGADAYGALQGRELTPTPMLVSLINQEADINLALLAAALHNDGESIERLITQGADVNAQIDDGTSVLQITRRRFWPDSRVVKAASHRGQSDIVKTLIEHGADVNAQGGYYGTALQAASDYGAHNIVEMLIEHGADVNAQGGYYGTALQAASCLGDFFGVEMLIEHGADINAKGGHFGTALQAASYQGMTNVVKMLIKHGADVNAEGGNYGTALRAASNSMDPNIRKILLEHGAVV